MPWWLAALNTFVAIGSAGFGIAALARPAILTPVGTPSPIGRLYPGLYAGRAIPLGAAVGICVWITDSTPLLLLLLGVAAIAQLADVAIGLSYRMWGMAIGGFTATVCHVAAMLAVALA